MTPRLPFLLDDEVAKMVPAGARGQLEEMFRQGQSATCALCGQQQTLTWRRPMAVLAAEGGGGTVLALGHPACLRAQGAPSSAQLLGAADEGLDARAFFGERLGCGGARMVMAFETTSRALAALPNGETLDVFVRHYLGEGFELLLESPLTAAPETAAGWTLTVTSGELQLSQPQGELAYVQDLNPDLRRWHAQAAADGQALVLTGTGLRLGQGEPLSGLQECIAAGRCVAATVRVCAGP